TTLHATTLRSDFSKAVELIADIAFHSTFHERELAKEREVIADEINTYKDSPSELIYDCFEDMIFRDSELGHNILGTKAALNRYSTQQIADFIGRTHTTDQMVFSSIGNFSVRTAQQAAMKYLADAAPTQRSFARVRAAEYVPFEMAQSRHTHQTHCIIGNRGYGISDRRRLPLALLTNILGGPSANSLLNITLREKHGLSYNIEASYTPYTDDGLVAIYFSSDHCNADQCIDLIHKQMERLRTTPLSARALSTAKKQFIAQMSISMESNEGYMLGAGKSYLIHNDIDTLEQAYDKVMALTASQITDVAQEVFANTSQLIYK
ncbi:MAG: insulinase family protein, partial [Alistipes sp.]|nr:insulinase family protein [Alistipes sp.]